MGMDLMPARPKGAALEPNGVDPRWMQYNWAGWRELVRVVDEAGVSTLEFAGCNDGDRISAATCREVADAIEALPPGEERTLFIEDAPWWRDCGGCRQY